MNWMHADIKSKKGNCGYIISEGEILSAIETGTNFALLYIYIAIELPNV